MAVFTTLLCVIAGWILVLRSDAVVGRVASLWVGSVCGAALAYFVMPPVFSFQVSEPRDLIMLAAYGLVGFAIFQSHRRRGPGHSFSMLKIDYRRYSTRPSIALADSLADVLRSDVGKRLLARRVDLTCTALPVVPGQRADAAAALCDLLTAALDSADVTKLIIVSSPQPDVERICIYAQRTEPPVNRTVIIGRSDLECENFIGQGWPPSCRASWFDNGYGTIYQLSFSW